MSDAAAPVVSGALEVLLLEDSTFDAELLRESLRASCPQARVTWVQDEAPYVQALRERRFDVILSDYQLPRFSGTQALDHALALAPETPFIFVSGVIGEENAVDLLKRGATDYVIKGRLARLPIVIARALREVRQRDARRAAEAQLHDADALYARVVDSLQDYAVLLLDREGRVRQCNRATTLVFGHAPEALRGASSELLYTAEDRARHVLANQLAQALRSGSAHDSRWMLRADGSRLRAACVMTPLYSRAGEHSGFSKIVHDVTSAWQASEALRRSKEEAERANRAKDRFLAVLSHELRTPLAPISAAAHALERAATVPEKLRHLLPMIRRNVALEARLIDDLLDLTAISAGKVVLQSGRVDLHRLLDQVAEMVEGDARAKELTLELRKDAADPVVEGDEARLQQVLWNIVRNAVKFTPEGGRITVATGQGEGAVTVRCTDTGLGIHPDALPRIFLPFEQADTEVSHRFGGLGLGLAIAHGLVQQHRGRLTVTSPGRGKGATFELRLPQGRSAPAAGPATADAAAEAPARELRVLLVEDNADAGEAMAISLRGFGYEVVHASSRHDALEVAGGQHFDVAITDLGLPDGSGIDLGRALCPRMPVIALSGYGTRRDLDESARAGFSAHLVKPADPGAVHKTVQRVMGSAR